MYYLHNLCQKINFWCCLIRYIAFIKIKYSDLFFEKEKNRYVRKFHVHLWLKPISQLKH